jgi:hypothetical protein
MTPFNESLRLTPEQIAEFHKQAPAAKSPDSARQKGTKYTWTSYSYEKQLDLAKSSRIPLLAVLAELHRLHFQARNKKAPIELGNSRLRTLGFSHHDKKRALHILERAGWITVKWNKLRTPQVTIVSGFTHGV